MENRHEDANTNWHATPLLCELRAYLESARQFAETWQEVFGDKRATLILGVLQDKDLRGICEALLPIARRVMALPVQSPRSATAQEICRAFEEIAPRQECIAVRDLPAAPRIAESMGRRALIARSLFLVGEALAHLQAVAVREVARSSASKKQAVILNGIPGGRRRSGEICGRFFQSTLHELCNRVSS